MSGRLRDEQGNDGGHNPFHCLGNDTSTHTSTLKCISCDGAEAGTYMSFPPTQFCGSLTLARLDTAPCAYGADSPNTKFIEDLCERDPCSIARTGTRTEALGNEEDARKEHPVRLIFLHRAWV